MKISNSQIDASYAVAKRVYAKELEKEQGAKELHAELGMNPASARDYIKNFNQLMSGMIFHRTMNAYATDYYLTNIYKDYGTEFLTRAISATQKHIEYYEGLRPGSSNKIRQVVERHAVLMKAPADLELIQKSFSQDVQKSFEDSAETRRKRLKGANRQPKKTATISVIFIRNPDVVAEVLHRASGKCERCNEPAPFLRKRDQSPYLEVHHTIQLADGGEDTVKNAMALCPNCHRELHFGV